MKIKYIVYLYTRLSLCAQEIEMVAPNQNAFEKNPNCFEALDLIKCYQMIFEELIVFKMHYLPPLSLQSPFKRGRAAKRGP